MTEQKKTQITLPSDREIRISRTFDAPRVLVWEMWTRSEHLRHWWGPKDWTLPVSEMDFRKGGSWFYCMEGPDGFQSCGKSHYLEVDEPRRIVLRDLFVDAAGNALDGMPVAQTTMEFVEVGGRTTVTSIVEYATKADRDKVIEMGMEAGIDQTLDRLEVYLSQME